MDFVGNLLVYTAVKEFWKSVNTNDKVIAMCLVYYFFGTQCRYGSHSFTCKLHHTCLYLVRVHQTAPPLIVMAYIQLQLTTRLSTQKG